MYDVKDFIKPFKRKRDKQFYWEFYNVNQYILKYIILDQTTVSDKLKRQVQNEMAINRHIIKHKSKLTHTLVPTKVSSMTNKDKLPQNGYYIKMDRMSGNIGELSNKNVDWNHILIQILIGIKELNAIHIAHKDLAPRNILYRKLDKPKDIHFKWNSKKYTLKSVRYEIRIADFGLSSLINNTKKKQSLRNNVAYLTSSLVFDIDYRIKDNPKFKLNKSLKKKITGFNSVQKILDKSCKHKKVCIENPTLKFNKKDVLIYIKDIINVDKIFHNLIK
jgi:serine/threonine protein kinase